MGTITPRALSALAAALGKHAGQAEFSHDVYWRHPRPDGVPGPVLCILLAARNPMVGGPALLADHPVTVGPFLEDEIERLVGQAVGILRQAQRNLPAGKG